MQFRGSELQLRHTRLRQHWALAPEEPRCEAKWYHPAARWSSRENTGASKGGPPAQLASWKRSTASLKSEFVRRSDMLKLIVLAFAAVLLLAAANPEHDKFAKYKSVEAYEIRPGILMMPRYSSDGQVCQIGLEKLHYSPETIRL